MTKLIVINERRIVPILLSLPQSNDFLKSFIVPNFLTQNRFLILIEIFTEQGLF